jgi:hydrogenase nickel incorporation protein HypA/HybF
VHELAIADAVVRIAAAHARGRAVARVELRVGRLRQVVPAALEFGFDVVSRGTPVEGAELALEEVPARVSCRRCGGGGEPEAFPLACARCGSLDVEVVAGEELVVDALELDEEQVMSEEVGRGS